MARLLPYYDELKEKFNQDRFQGLNFKALQLFILHFLPDRSIFAIFGLEDLYQAGTLSDVHFRDLDSWDWDWDCSMPKDLDCLDEIVNELDERGELDNLDESDESDEPDEPDESEEPDEPDEPNEPDEQDKEEPPRPVALIHEPIRSELSAPVALVQEPIRSELRALIRQGDLEAVKRVLDMTPGTVDAETLSIAIERYKPDIFCRLLKHGAQVNGNAISSPLCDAAKYGNKDAVQLLLSRGANKERGVGGWTPLTHAACNGHFEIVRYLVDEQGANVNGARLDCPLSHAIANGHTRIVDYLLASGADVFKDHRPRYSRSRLRGLSANPDPPPWSPFKENHLICRNHKTYYPLSFERLVAHCCARTRYLLLSRAAADGNLDLVEYLVSFGVDLNSTEKKSPLYLATENCRYHIVRFLLEHATDVQPANVSDLLWCAVENGDLETIYLLLGCGPQLHPTLLNKLLKVAGYSGDHYRVEADGNAYDGLLMRLPKDESFDESLVHWDSWVSDIRDFCTELVVRFWHKKGANTSSFVSWQSHIRRAIITKLAAKVVSALEKPYNVNGYGASIFIESIVQGLPNGEVADLEDCPVVAAIQAQERRTILRRLFAKIGSSLKRLLHAGASQGASTGLVNFAHKAATETSRAIWKRGTRVIRNIGKRCLTPSLPEIVNILQVANAMRSAVPASDLVCSRQE